MRTLALVVAYDGSGFHGWQVQPGQRTVQGVLEEALAGLLGKAVRVHAAGRTDTGCHARGQVASFACDTTLPVTALPPALNTRLPEDVRVRDARAAHDAFDARRSATARRYSYRLLDAEDLLMRRIAWHPRRRIAAEGLERAVRPLEGDHDCAALQAAGSTATVTRCEVRRAGWRRWDGGLVLDMISNHFLYHMVRNVVGTALMLQNEPDPGAAMLAVLRSGDRVNAGPTAPPEGLCLEQVFYPEAVWA